MSDTLVWLCAAALATGLGTFLGCWLIGSWVVGVTLPLGILLGLPVLANIRE